MGKKFLTVALINRRKSGGVLPSRRIHLLGRIWVTLPCYIPYMQETTKSFKEIVIGCVWYVVPDKDSKEQ